MKSLFLLALAGIRRRKTQAALTVSSLLVATILLATTLGIFRGAARPFDRFFELLSASHILLFFDYPSTDVPALRRWLAAREEVLEAGIPNPVYTPSNPIILRDEKLDIAIQLTERTESNLVQDQLLLLAGSAKDHPAINEIWLPRHLAATYHINLGDTLGIPSPSGLYPLLVTALVVDPHYISGIVNPNRAWLAPGALSFFLPAGSLRDAMLGIRLKDPAAAGALWTELKKTGLFHGNHLTYQQFRSFFLSFYQLLGAILAVFGVLALTMALIIISATVSNAILADYRSIGISKAVGLTPGNVVGAYVIQYLLLAAPALAGGFAGSYYLIRGLFASLAQSVGLANIELSCFQPFALTAAIALPAVTLIALRQAARAGRIKAVDAIRWGAPPPKPAISGVLRKDASLFRVPLPAFLASRFLLTNRRRTIGAILSLLMAVQVIIFSINVSHSFGQMKNNKARWGLDNSDLQVILKKDIYLPLEAAHFEALLARDDRIEHYIASHFLGLVIPPQEGRPGLEVFGRAYDTDPDRAGLTNLVGEHPRGPTELSLCTLTARHYGKKPGDSLAVILEGQPLTFRITGIYQDVSNLGHGFRLTGAAIRTVNPLFEPDTYGLKLRPEVPVGVFKTSLENTFGEQIAVESGVEDRKAIGQVITGMQLAMLTLSLLFIFIISVTLVNDLVLGVREQQQSLGLLKMMGFTPRQLRQALILKSLLLTGAALLVGMPLALWLSPRLISLLTASIGLEQFPYLTQLPLTASVIPGLLAFGWIISSVISRRLLQNQARLLIQS